MKSSLGLFDSGVGGFSVLKKVIERHGDISCLYLGDTARVPYGPRKPSEIRIFAKEIMEWLNQQDLTAILVACNTTNSVAFDIVERISSVPVFGLLKSVASVVHESRVGVLATPATVASNAYKNEIETRRPHTRVFQQSCPAFVPLVEAGELNSDSTRKLASQYLGPLLDANVESLILGCSHYPLLRPLLEDLIPRKVRIIDPADALAKDLDDVLGIPTICLKHVSSIMNTRFFVTSNPIAFSNQIKDFFGNTPQVQLISLLPKACFF